jgi:hypothetical protein
MSQNQINSQLSLFSSSNSFQSLPTLDFIDLPLFFPLHQQHTPAAILLLLLFKIQNRGRELGEHAGAASALFFASSTLEAKVRAPPRKTDPFDFFAMLIFSGLFSLMGLSWIAEERVVV